MVEIEKDKGLDYAEKCCRLLHDIRLYYLDKKKVDYDFYARELPDFTNEFERAVEALARSEYVRLPKSQIDSCMKTLMKHAKSISNESWVFEWSNDVAKYFENFMYLVKYAHKEIQENLQKKKTSLQFEKQMEKERQGIPINEDKLKPHRIVIAAPMPFGGDEAFYDERNDLLVFLTCGIGMQPQLYVDQNDRKHGFNPYEGFGLPKGYPETVYLISHEVAHRCMHLSLPKQVDHYLHHTGIVPSLEEIVCRTLALDVMLYRAEFDRKLRRKDVYRLFGKEFGPHYIYLKDRK